MKANETALKESPDCETFRPAVVVCIADHKSGQDEEEVDRQVAVVQDLLRMVSAAVALQQVEGHHQYGGDSAKPIKNVEARFVCKNDYFVVHCFMIIPN